MTTNKIDPYIDVMLLASFAGNAEKSNSSILEFIFFFAAGDRLFMVFAKRYSRTPAIRYVEFPLVLA